MRNLGIILDGSVLIVDGIVREVGPARRLDNLASARRADEINATGRVVLPGFVDSHTHLVSGPSRLLDYEMHLAGAPQDEIARAGGGFQAMFRTLQDVPLRILEAQAWRVIQECVRQGTTTLEAKSGYGINEPGELKLLRTGAAVNEHLHNVVSTFMGARFMPEAPPRSPEEYVAWLCGHMLPLVWRRKLAEFVDLVCDGEIFTPDQTRRMLSYAKGLGFGLKLHAGQHRTSGAIRLGIELGAVSVDHAVHVDGDDIAALARSSTIATLLPGTVFYLGSERYAPARTMIDHGVAVALATNYNPATSPSHNMQVVLSLACRKMNMTPAEAISAATINGAHALRGANRIGSIEPGKEADLILLSVPDYREIPYHFGVNLVEATMKRGRIIYRASEVKWPDN